ncbi:MAG: lysine--tRNA ligase [Myxococcales bacterium]|nr:lysine--tRNA ligase [Myxococcales bacterium]
MTDKPQRQQPDNAEQQAPQDVSKLMQQRQQKADALREMGVNPYATGFSPTHSTAEVLAKFADAEPPAEPSKDPQPLSEERFRLAGRMVEHRSFGKAAFVKLANDGVRMQVYIKRDVVGVDAYKAFKKTEAWDFIGVEGYVFFTKTGELTLLAESVRVLTKAVRPPPEKWSGLKDQETRYRQRYVDLVANPEVAEVFRTRTRVIKGMRRYFDEHGFLEVETPLLHPTLGGAAARPFKTHHNALDMELYLRIAPELYLKRLLVGGFDRVYEIGRNFRNEGLSRKHNPEFTMIEFYWAYATYHDLMDLTEELVTGLVKELHGEPKLTYQGQGIDFTRPWRRMSVLELVVAAGKRFDPLLDEDTARDEAKLVAWLAATKLSTRDDQLGEKLRFADSHGKRLGVLFDELGEEQLPMDRPVFVIDYPAAMSPLSRRKDDDPDFVDRFELFICQRELCNAFSELNDPVDQRARFQAQVDDKARGDDEAMEYDEDYCRALEFGMPPAAGWGMGVDRLVMFLCDQASIRDVLLFPHMRPE